MASRRASSRQYHFFKQLTGVDLPPGATATEATRLINAAIESERDEITARIVSYLDGASIRWRVSLDHVVKTEGLPSPEAAIEWLFQHCPNVHISTSSGAPGRWLD